MIEVEIIWRREKVQFVVRRCALDHAKIPQGGSDRRNVNRVIESNQPGIPNPSASVIALPYGSGPILAQQGVQLRIHALNFTPTKAKGIR
jgi:hypothetical protein